MSNPLVSIICPVYNAADYIDLTIKSVLGQTYSNIEFIIIDGKSSDETMSIIACYGNLITHVLSEIDMGMYDALTKGFMKASGEIVCYINAGDFLNSYAVEVAVDIFKDSKINWITGYRSICNENNIVTHVDLPFRYKKSLIQSGSYGTILPYIQQESTFWRRSLLGNVDFKYLRQLKYAGDYFLWWSFSKTTELQVISSPLGVFKKHRGQLSENMDSYFQEMKTFVIKKDIFTTLQLCIELILWGLHPRIRAFFDNSVYRFDHKKQQWAKRFC